MTPKVRIVNDPNEEDAVAACRAQWRNHDTRYVPQSHVSVDDVAGWENGERVQLVPSYEMTTRPQLVDLPGWHELTELEQDAVVALDYGEPAKETAEQLGRTVKSIERARQRARKKLLEAMKQRDG
jgi:hypothetical protein